MVNSVAIVKTSSLGDILQAFGALHYLRKKLPTARIAWIAERAAEDLLRSHPLLDAVYTIDTQSWRKNLFTYFQGIRSFKRSVPSFDLLFDLQGNCKSALITGSISATCKVGFGWKSVAEKPNVLLTHRRINVKKQLHASQKYIDLVRGYFQDDLSDVSCETTLRISPEEKVLLDTILSCNVLIDRPLWLIAPGSIWINKQLPDSVWMDFVSHYKKPAFIVVFRGDKEEKRAQLFKSLAPDRTLAIGDVSLAFLQALMKRVHLVVSVDSALLHLCATTHTPSFSFFGPSSAAVYRPLGEQHSGFQGICPYNEAFFARCPKLRTCPTGACLRGVSFVDIFNNLKE